MIEIRNIEEQVIERLQCGPGSSLAIGLDMGIEVGAVARLMAGLVARGIVRLLAKDACGRPVWALNVSRGTVDK